MKGPAKLLLKGFLFMLPLAAYYLGYNGWLVYTGQIKGDAAPIYRAIKKSKQKATVKKVVFGDSVGAQLYPNNQTDSAYVSLTTSAPSSLVGIYLLLLNYMQHNPVQGTTFYYIAHPGSLGNHLHGKYTYNHFVKPFYTPGNYRHFTTAVNDSIQSIPHWYLAQLPFLKVSDWQPEFAFEENLPKGPRNLSAIYVQYLQRIDSLAKQHGFTFKVVAPLLREDQQATDYNLLKQQIQQNGLQHLFQGYFENMRYLPNSSFHTGSNHYRHPAQLGYNPLGL